MSSAGPHPALPLVAGDESRLNKNKHINYWKRCLKTYLPHQYISNDSNRMTLAFFILSALDLLDALKPGTTEAERKDYAQWIYRCQHPEGGFRGFPGTDFGELRSEENKAWDPANLPATYFALAALVILEDNLENVKRRECLEWLTRLQRQGGSFGETIGENGRIEGGHDPRLSYCATAVRFILRGKVEGPVEGVPDINVDALVECLRRSETYDGGIAEAPYHEAHAGFTYCTISALSFLNRLPTSSKASDTHRKTGLTNLPLTLHWLASRQTATLTEADAFDTLGDETDTPATCHDAHSFVEPTTPPSARGAQSFASRPSSHFETAWAGFNGRCNKLADTCYAFWACGSLSTLNHLDLIDAAAGRRYLLDRTQHLVGGFGKMPGDPPDIYHSYLGLATLGVLGEEGVKGLDAALCVSVDAMRSLERLTWRRKITGEAEQEVENETKAEEKQSAAGEPPTKELSYMAITGG